MVHLPDARLYLSLTISPIPKIDGFSYSLNLLLSPLKQLNLLVKPYILLLFVGKEKTI